MDINNKPFYYGKFYIIPRISDINSKEKLGHHYLPGTANNSTKVDDLNSALVITSVDGNENNRHLSNSSNFCNRMKDDHLSKDWDNRLSKIAKRNTKSTSNFIGENIIKSSLMYRQTLKRPDPLKCLSIEEILEIRNNRKSTSCLPKKSETSLRRIFNSILTKAPGGKICVL